MRLDGYHILADLTGVPDLFAHIRPVVMGLLPWRWGRPENKKLRLARAVVTAWVLVVMPLLIYTLVMLIMVFPPLVATAWDSLGFRWTELRAAFGKGDIFTGGAVLLGMAALAAAGGELELHRLPDCPPAVGTFGRPPPVIRRGGRWR